jgi:hypothetical protein
VKILGVAYPVTTTVVVMATGNHYLLDAIAGAITMAAGALLASALPKRGLSADLPAGADSVRTESAGDDDVTPPSTAADALAGGETTLRHFPGHSVPLAGATANKQFCRPNR